MMNKQNTKLRSDLKEAIIASKLKNGDTISFHHAFRSGDLIINNVIATIAEMGFKNITLASSSLTDCHAPLVEYIQAGVITKIYTSGLRGRLADEISQGLMINPVEIHSHGGRVHLIQSGELKIDVAFLGAPIVDMFGNANAISGRSLCGSLGYAKIDAAYAKYTIILAEELVDYPNSPASIAQDCVDSVVLVDQLGDPSKIGGGATRMTTNPRELLIAKKTADVIEHSGYFHDGFSLQTGSGGASLAVTQFLESKMVKKNITASFGLGGITAKMVELHEKGLIKKLLDVQSFDATAAKSLACNKDHIEISANQYANPSSKGASVDLLDVVILSALEIDTKFNVNVITGSDGIIRGASGGHCDAAVGAKLAIVVAPLVRGRIPTLVPKVLNCVTMGSSIDVLVTDHGIAVNPARQDIKEHLEANGIATMTIEALQQRAELITGSPSPIKYTDRIVANIRYRDGSILDYIYQVTN
ncbi:citrate lyase subunit alpha [Photobacterium toruni]|uniref:Citrate lyase alpha chain n=1 Tax=Photobacterium toruni TaxID=1935446 RepID=A0ABU6LBK1_9GAMM|nr:citrate lyase subunit alpha [Photobacterium toruni]